MTRRGHHSPTRVLRPSPRQAFPGGHAHAYRDAMARKAPKNDPDQHEPRVGTPKQHAVGLPAALHSLRIGHQQMGAVRTLRSLAKVNQKDGFDCPGCAWPESDKRHVAEFCENGAKAVAEEATTRRVGPAFFAQHPVSELAEASGYWLGQQGRLTHPMLLEEGATHYTPVSWDRAFSLIAEELRGLDTPDQAVFYTSGRTSNEAAFLYQLFARRLGTNNLPDCSNMCHESSGEALTETLGVGKGSVHLEDLPKADLIIIAGQNPGTNHPRMLTTLEAAKQGGTRILTLNPLPEAGLQRFHNPQTARGMLGSGTQLSDLFLQLRLDGDLAFFRALNRTLLDSDQIDHDFVEHYTHGLDEFAATARATSDADIHEACGLTAEELAAARDEVGKADNVIVCWAMGLTQHRDSVPTIREIVNFLLLTGNIGRPGAGACPVRGHSNVQGDRTMGIFERPAASFLDALGDEFSFAPPREDGLDTVDSIRAMRDGQAHVLFAMGGNFVAATPDTEVTEEAIRRCRLTVHVSTKLNRSHAVTGARALILPTLGRTDKDLRGDGVRQFVTVEDSMGKVHASRGNLPAAHPELLSEPAIIARLAHATFGPDDPVDWERLAGDYDRIREHIQQVVPGFADFNNRARRPEGFTLPHAPRDDRTFPTPSGKAEFTSNELTVRRVPPGRLLLQTLRAHDQYNTTIYGLDDRYRGIQQGRRVVLVHPDDIADLGLTGVERVDVVSEWDDDRARRAADFRLVPYPTARGCAAAYYPETNVLVPLDSTAEKSHTPTSKSLVIRLEAARQDT